MGSEGYAEPKGHHFPGYLHYISYASVTSHSMANGLKTTSIYN